jgi:hypothetical protein
MLEIRYKRYYPKSFFYSTNDKQGVVSLSEQMSRAIIIHTLELDENTVVKGYPGKKQPDYIIDNKNGMEVTFAASASTIPQILTGHFDGVDIENEIATSIVEACERKMEKVIEGNYANVESTGLFLIELEPIYPWYQEAFGGTAPELGENRDALFAKLYEYYIVNGVFSDIYLLIFTELENYVLFSIRAFNERHADTGAWMKEIKLLNRHALPYYKATSLKPTPGADIHYIVEDVVWF